jgi:hypothetical protein
MKKSLKFSLIIFLALGIITAGFILADNSTGSVNITTINNTSQNTTGNTTPNATPPIINTTPPILNPPQPTTTNMNIGNIPESSTANQIKTTQALSQEVVCRINFNIGVVNEFASQFPNASSNLQASLTTLQNDLSQVQSLGSSSDVQNFVRGQYSSDIKNVQSSIPTQQVRGLSISKRATLVSDYNQLMATYQQCEKANYMNIIQERINGYQIQIANFQNKTNALAAKGFDVTSLNQLLQNAQTQIVTPLQNSIANSNTVQQVQTAARSYCLFDGCTNGTNFHLEAKFDVTRLNIILTSLQNNSTAFNLDSGTISQAQQYLSDAQSTLNTVGIAAYQKGQSQTIFSDIQNASKIIVQLITQALKQPVGGLK